MNQLSLFSPATHTDLQQRIITAIRNGHRRFGDMRRAAQGTQPGTPFLRDLRELEDTGQVVTRWHHHNGIGSIKEYEVAQ